MPTPPDDILLNKAAIIEPAFAVRRVWHSMNNVDTPMGAIHPNAFSGYRGGADSCEYTEWTAVAGLKSKTYSLRSFANPGALTSDFKSFDLDGKETLSKALLN